MDPYPTLRVNTGTDPDQDLDPTLHFISFCYKIEHFTSEMGRYLLPVFRVRISLNADPDPGFYLNTDPDPDSGFWIPHPDPRYFLPKN